MVPGVHGPHAETGQSASVLQVIPVPVGAFAASVAVGVPGGAGVLADVGVLVDKGLAERSVELDPPCVAGDRSAHASALHVKINKVAVWCFSIGVP